MPPASKFGFVKVAILIVLFVTNGKAQDFGFGCFGLLGGFAGYEVQNHEASGLNSFIDNYNNYYADSLLTPLGKYRQLRGLRLGLNLFRHNYSGLLLTVKGFYSSLSEKNKGTRILTDKTKSIFNTQLTINEVGVGIDLGMPITSEFHWKLFDAALIYYQAEFKTELNTSRGTQDSKSFKSSKGLFTYGLGSGFILNLIKNYVSLEGTVSYVNLAIVKLTDDTGEALHKPGTAIPIESYFIRRGGINLLIQLNIGLPM